MRHLLFFCFFLLSVTALVYFSGCNEDPTQLGTEFLQDTLTSFTLTNEDNIFTDFSSHLIYTPLARNTGTGLVGITPNYKAGILIRYNVPTGKNHIKEEDIISCQLHIPLDKYANGDTNSNFLSFDVREVTQKWNITETTYQDVLNSNLLFSAGPKISDWSGAVQRKDTMDTIVVDFSKTICIDWFEKIKDGIPGNIVDTIWGIGLIPNQECSIVQGIQASVDLTKTSFIRLVYKKEDDELDTFQFPAAESVSFVESFNDVDNNTITVQLGTRIHSKLGFDVSSLPFFSCVNSAEIILHIDTDKSDYGNRLNNDTTLFLAYYDDPDAKEDYIGIKSRILGVYDSTNKSVVFRINGHEPFNTFLRKKEGYGSLVLMASSPVLEFNSLDKWVFYDLNTPLIDKRPTIKLQITK